MKKLMLPEKGIVCACIKTSMGWLAYAVSSKGLKECRFMFETKKDAEDTLKAIFNENELHSDESVSEKWSELFVKYFAGKLKSFAKTPLDTSSWTDFSKKVYGAVKSIPYGRTASYGAVASYLGNEKASRAVGNALKRNPVPPIVPCHRVIAADKELCGFSANGGLDLKLKMIEMERSNP